MPRTVKLDLRGAPPVSGGMRDHIPPGRYRVKVSQVDDGTSRTGKRMWTASYRVEGGPSHGANLGDNFVLVDNNNAPSKIGLGRLHHFLLCIGFPVKEAALSFDLDALTGKECEVEVADEEFSSNGQTRTTSSVKQYHPIQKAANGAAAPPAAAPVAEAAPADVPFDLPQTAPAAAPAAAVEEVPGEEEIVITADAVDSLFQ